jgi:hypothetical protein
VRETPASNAEDSSGPSLAADVSWGRALLLIACTGLIGALWLVVARWTLVLLTGIAVPWLVWTAIRQDMRLRRRCLVVASTAVVLACVPVDLWIIRTGQRDVGVSRVIWGLTLSADGGRHDGLAAGCAPPLLNRTRYAVWVSY